MDGMLIPRSDRIHALAESIVWPMSLHCLRLELIDRLVPEFEEMAPHLLDELFEEHGIARRVGEETP